jgi:tetracycline resistance efflux pump
MGIGPRNMKSSAKKSTVKNIIGYCIVLLCFVAVALLAPQLEEGASYGAWTMLPPLCIFAFILLTKKILEGFFWTSLLAVFMRFRWSLLTGYIDQIFEQVTTWDNWWVIYLFLLGGAITYLFKISGAGTAFARWIASKVKSKKAALFITSLLGWPLSVDDYMSGLVLGSVMSPVLDEYGVPREMTAYVIRASVTAPACILPIGCWGIYVGAVFDMWELDIVEGYASGFGYYLANVLPWLFFPFAVVLVCWLVIFGVIPMFGKMKRAFQRVADGGSVYPPKEIRLADGVVAEEEEPEAAPEPRKRVNLSHFIVPVVAILFFGYIFEWDMAYGISWGLLVSFLYYCITGVFTTNDAKSVVTDGFGYMSEMCIMMGFGLVLCNNLDAIVHGDFGHI